MSTLVVDNIGMLVTNDEELGVVRDAALVIDDGVVAAVKKAGADGDDRIDAGGRCVIPGFVDSHTHLVFAGDRGDEFAARMAGAPYAAGGIQVVSSDGTVINATSGTPIRGTQIFWVGANVSDWVSGGGSPGGGWPDGQRWRQRRA